MTLKADDFFAIFFMLSSSIFLIAANVNHIDDTDETFGYWEPLHYLLYKKGMQTWEYSPAYSIRTYSFIYPVYIFGNFLKGFGLSSVTIFRVIRSTFGLFTAFAQAKFVDSLQKEFGLATAMLTAMFTLCSAGIFFSSTSYLPSAITMNLVTMSCSSWLDKRPLVSIFWGSVSVLWSGWPFVALLFAPLGLFMVVDSALDKNIATFTASFWSVSSLLLSGIVIATVVCVPTVLLDHHFYQKWTSPSLNILLYNAIGGSGDELYGVEPAGYYLRNLFLNLGIAWPLALAAPFAVMCEHISLGKSLLTRHIATKFTLFSLAVLWVAVLFSRPHKEERFMYPVYPLLAFAAAAALHSGVNCVEAAVGAVLCRVWGSKSALKSVVYFAVTAVSVCLCVSRVMSNRVNYGGYLALWSDAHELIAAQQAARLGDADRPVTVCTGSEWYLFPTHFFLPGTARLEFLDDGFGGILPQHFAKENGTWCEPSQPFNDRNREEPSRYVQLERCDYLVLLLDERQGPKELGSLRSGLMRDNEGVWPRHSAESDIGADATLSIVPRFTVVARRPVISTEHSLSSLGRAFFVPGLSTRTVRFRDYVLFRKQE